MSPILSSSHYFSLVILISNRCKDYFDYSDHVVLYIGQYIVPATIEMAFVYARTGFNRAAARSKYFLTMLIAFFMIAVSLRAMLMTCMFFHTWQESIVALFVVFVLLVYPLALFSNTAMWLNMVSPVALR